MSQGGLQRVDLGAIAAELADVISVARTGQGNLRQADAPRDFLGDVADELCREMRERVRRLLALIPGDIDLADCACGTRDALRRLREDVSTIEDVGGWDPLEAAVVYTSEHTIQALRIGFASFADFLSAHEAVASAHEAVALGGRRYRIGGQIIQLEETEDTVLTALCESGALSKDELIDRSGVAGAVGVLKRLVGKHPMLKRHVTVPGGRGRGGYQTTIQPFKWRVTI